jgi:hypothetical protein
VPTLQLLVCVVFLGELACDPAMPTISAFFVIVIQMFWRKHAPPHFHAIYADLDPAWLYDNLSDGKSCPLLTLEWEGENAFRVNLENYH